MYLISLKTNRCLGLAFIIVLIVCLACNTTSKVPNLNIKAEIQNQWDHLDTHWENEDTEKLLSIYTEDAINIPPESEPKKGRKEIGEFYDFLFDNNASSKYNHETLSLTQEGNIAIEYGEFKVDWIGNDGKEWAYRARSLAHWEQSEEGIWQIKMFMFNNPPEED